ncbi:YceI family protein [Paenibacillus sp. GCM10027627]|uniref:YceI family protein n=1 Tax=unclassified Paenibacillus TaxID=185978 RepID=UPI00362929CB
MKKNNKRIWIAAAVGLVCLTGGYATYDYFTGNHVEIEEVIPASGGVQPEPSSASAAVSVQADQLNGSWSIGEPSHVYFTVKTSREEVNFSMDSVTGDWLFDLNNPNNMTGEGIVDLASLSSGNSQRDSHIASPDFLQTDAHPTATFKASSFELNTSEWKEGQVVPLSISGTMNVKGIDKEVVFDSQALYSENSLKLSGTTKVTFEDFGLTNPHKVVLSTENELTVRLELQLTKA